MNIEKEPEMKVGITNGIYLNSIENSLPYLEAELSLFPNIKVIPSVSAYKLRNSEIYYEGIRVMPSYIMTGEIS